MGSFIYYNAPIVLLQCMLAACCLIPKSEVEDD